MANRENTFLLKRSNVPGKIPLPGDIKLGEVALNTADVILYASGTTANSILPIGWDRISRTGDTVTGNFNIFGDVKISGSSLPSGYALTVTGDTDILGDLYVEGDVDYNGNLIVSGGAIIQSGLTANTIYTDYIDFNTGATVTQSPGRINWDSGTGTLNITVGDTGTGLIDLQVGQEEIVRVWNAEATTLQKGEVVYVSGSQGNRPSVKRASALSDGYSVTTLGMVDRPIAPGVEGYVTTFGIISNLNTNSYTGGTPLYLSPTTPGAYTSIKPIAPQHTVFLGYVVRQHPSTGSIFVNISNGWELDEIHDVRISGATTGDLLVRSSYAGTPVWVNSKTLKGNYTISGNTSFIGSLSAKTTTGINWFSGNTSTDMLRVTQVGSGNALVVEDNRNPDSSPFVINNVGNVGIGTTLPNAKLAISGQTNFSGETRYYSPNPLHYGYISPTNLGVGSGTGLRLGHSASGIHIDILNTNRTVFYQSTYFRDGAPLSSPFGVNIGDRLTINNGIYTGSTNTLIWAGNNANSNIFKIQGNSRIAINKSTALAALDISGTTLVSGNLGVGTTNPTARLQVINSNKSLTTALISGSGTNSLTVIGSGTSTSAPIFKVQGSSGELFSVTDSLTGSLFSVNDISGLPILEVFSDNTILMGSYAAPSLNTTSKITANIGTTTVYSIPKTEYTGSFFDYTVSDGTNLRAGNIMSVWSGSTIRFTEVQTTDIGNTNNIKFIMSATTNNILLRASAATNSWTVKTIVRSI